MRLQISRLVGATFLVGLVGFFLVGSINCRAADASVPPALDRALPRRPSVRLSLDSAPAPLVGQFGPEADPVEISFSTLMTGRYLCLETLSAHDGRPYAALAEIYLRDDKGQEIDRSGWSIAYVDSEEWTREDGLAENVFDGSDATIWHSEWGNVSPNHPHHLVLDLGRSRMISGLRYIPRPGLGSLGGRIKDYRIYVGDDLVEQTAPIANLPPSFYLFAYFTGAGEDGLHLAYSLNGYRWDELDHGRSILKPEVGEARLMRDPCLVAGPDGTFHLVWTAAWAGNLIGYASSKDLIHWSAQRALPVMGEIPGTVNSWAPELFWDERNRQFLIFWASTVTQDTARSNNRPDNNRIYCTTTRDFNTFSPVRKLYDPGASVIDATLTQAGGLFYLIFKDDKAHRMSIATANDPEGPFSDPGPLLGQGRLEGPAVFRCNGQQLIIYHRMGGGYGAVKSADLEHWDDITLGMSLPPGAQQGSVLILPGVMLRAFAEGGHVDLGTTSTASELGIGDWIWAPFTGEKQTCRFWRGFVIPNDSQVTRAELKMTADNGYTAFLDGREIGRGGDVNCLTEYDLTLLLTPGHHVLAVEAFNETMDAGMTLGLQVKLSNGRKIQVFSDSSWQLADEDAHNWKTSRHARPEWPSARIVGYAGKAWWQYPHKTIQAPPLQPPVSHFWQHAWFLVLLLLLCLTVLVLCVRLALSLALHARSQRLLERERARIARDIHDDLGAGLTQLTLLGEVVLRETPREAGTCGRLSELCSRSRALLKSMDELVWAVNSRRDTVPAFAAFVSEHAQEFLGTTSILCRLEVAEELPAVPLDLPHRRNLMLAVKEAIRNAAHHSEASEITLRIRVANQNLEVVVEDNGKGFAPDKINRERNGVTNMQQRLHDLAGSCSIVSSPGSGCRITFILPLAAPAHEGWFSRLARGFRSHEQSVKSK